MHITQYTERRNSSIVVYVQSGRKDLEKIHDAVISYLIVFLWVWDGWTGPG